MTQVIAPPTLPAIEVDMAYGACEEITRREAANFYYGIRLLPRDKRRAMSAVYAFARRVDDIGDGDDEQRCEVRRARHGSGEPRRSRSARGRSRWGPE